MVWWNRTERLPQVDLTSRPVSRKHSTATGAGVPARRSFAREPCVAVVASSVTNPGMTEEDLTTVTIDPDLEAQILRYYHVEKWRVGTIARQLRLHPDTVSRVLAQAGLPRLGPPQRPSRIDPFLPFISETLEKFPSLTASRLFGMVRERGYDGAPDHFRHLIARHRPAKARQTEAYLRLRTLPGEQAQVDWGHFGHLTIGQARRPLMAFVMVLSCSRSIFLRFFLNARMESFLAGHIAAFEAWNGLPRVLLYDNLKSAVLERHTAAERLSDGGLQFGGAIAVQKPGQGGGDDGEGVATLGCLQEQALAGRRRLEETVILPMMAGGALVFDQRFDMGGRLDLRPLVIAARMAGDNLAAVDDANLFVIGQHGELPTNMGVRDRVVVEIKADIGCLAGRYILALGHGIRVFRQFQ